jgi:hypothetical protein
MPQHGTNWTAIVGIGLTLGLNFGAAMYFGGAIASDVRHTREDVAELKQKREAKDDAQDGRINALESRQSVTESKVQALVDRAPSDRTWKTCRGSVC